MSPMTNTFRGLGLAACLALAVTPAAHASIVTFDGQTKSFRYKASQGETNDVTMIVRGSTRVSVRDPGANIVGGPCDHPDPDNWHYVTCTLPTAAKQFRVLLGDQDDFAETHALAAFARPVVVNGGSGNDAVHAYGGKKTTLYGETGTDWLLDEDAAAILSGGDQPDVLIGGGGTDLLMGGSGADYLYGDGGDDYLNARERFGPKDAVIDCGSGTDTAKLDASEAGTSFGCEHVR